MFDLDQAPAGLPQCVGLEPDNVSWQTASCHAVMAPPSPVGLLLVCRRLGG